jgi:hypothetical protein
MGECTRSFKALAACTVDFVRNPDLSASTNGLNGGLKDVAVAVADAVGVKDPVQTAKEGVTGPESRTRQVKAALNYN